MRYDKQRDEAATEAQDRQRRPARIWLPSAMQRLMSQRAQADELRVSMSPGWREAGQTTVEGTIVGHASPAWKHPKGGDPKALNDALSGERADAAHTMLAEMLREALGARASIDMRASGSNTAASESPRGDDAARHVDDVMVGGVGDVSAADIHGPESDDPMLRRVDITLAVTHDVDGEAGTEEAFSEAYVEPGRCHSNASRRWAVKLSVLGAPATRASVARSPSGS